MTVCRFFQQGCCRFGNNCRFEHANPYKYSNYTAQPAREQANPSGASNVTTEQLFNQVLNDTNETLNGGQWILSSYAPFKLKPNFPGMLDISPEEVRLQMYEAKLNGTLIQVENHVKQLQAEAIEKLKCLLKPSGEVANVIECIYRGENPPDPFVSQSQSAGFSQNSFGNNMAPQPVNNIFGGSPQNTNASSLFANAAQNLFQASNTPSVFGGQSSTFGQNNAFPTQMESGLNNGGFNVFGQQQQQQANSFAPNNEPINFSNNSFAQPNPSVFGNCLPQQQPNVNSNIFGQAVQNVSPSASALFASANANIPASVPTNVFGQPTNTPPVQQNQNPFNVQPAAADPFQKPFSVFETPSNNTNLFGRADTSNIVENIYSKLEELTEQHLKAFKSDHFEKGLIPEVPPPLELCK